MKPIRWLVPVIAGVLLAMAVPAVATPITWAFSGTVYAIADDADQMGGIVHVGDLYTATWVFDSATPDLDSIDFWGRYAGLSATLTMPGFSVAKTGDLSVLNGTSSFDWLVFNTPQPGIRFLASLQDNTLAALSSDALPTQIDISDFPDRYLGVWWDPGPAKFFASIDSVSVTFIPEPGMFGLILLGLTGLRMRARRGA